MAAPASGVDFDRDRIGPGELIAGISGLVLLISLWFKWYGVKISGGGILKGFEPSITAWQAFDFVDILLFLIALLAIGVAVMRGLNRMPDMPYPPATVVAAAGGLALVLVLFRAIVTPIDTGGVDGIDVTRKFGLLIGLLSAAGVAYGGWRAMQDGGHSFGSAGGPGAPATSGTAPTTTMPPGGSPGVPGGGAAGVGEEKAGPGAPHPGTSTGGPGGDDTTPPAASGAPDPVPGQTAPQTPPGIPGDPPAGGGTTPPGIAGDRNPPAA
jgi:hypothetical protein